MSVRPGPIYQLTIIGIYGPDGKSVQNKYLTRDVINSIVAIVTETPCADQVNLLLSLSTTMLSTELLLSSAGKLEACQVLDNGMNEADDRCSSSTNLRQAFRVFALSDSEPASKTIDEHRQLIRLGADRSGACCFLHKFIAVQILNEQRLLFESLDSNDVWLNWIRNDSHWKAESEVAPQPSHSLLRLQVWRWIGAAIDDDDFHLPVSVAALDVSGGFANGPSLPWPTLTGDWDYFTRNTRNETANSDCCENKLRAVNISGRLTFEQTPESIALDPRRIHLVIGSSLATVAKGIDLNSFITLPSFEAAKDYARWLADNGLASGTAWVMGGQEIYRHAVVMETSCRRVYLTRVFAQHLSANRFFPLVELAENYRLESVSEEICEHGIRYRFEVHCRRN